MIYKNYDGKKIDKCGKCGHTYRFMFEDWRTFKAPNERSRKIRNINTVPLWCPLEDYKIGRG